MINPLPELGYDPASMLPSAHNEATIKAHTGYELVLAYPDFYEPDVWLAFLQDSYRVAAKLSVGAVRSYRYQADRETKSLGIFVRHDDLARVGIEKVLQDI